MFAGYYSLRSLGDLLLSTLVLAFWMIFVYQDIASIRISPKYAKSQVLYALVLSPAFLVTFLYSTLIHYLQYNLIFNSKISLEVNNLFELNSYSYAVMFIVFVLMFSYFLLTDAIVKSIIGSYKDWKFHAVVLLAAMACFLLFVNNFLPTEIYRTYDYTTFILAVVVIILLYFFRSQNRKLFSFVSAFTVIVVFSIYTAYLVNNLNHEKELQQRILVASKIAEKKDPVAEYLFSDNNEKQLHDKILISYFDELRSESEPGKVFAPQRISQRINQLYFNDAYWSKYEMETYLFNENKQPISENNSFQLYSYNQLVEMIDTLGNSTTAKNFFQINNFSSRNAYLATITITDPDLNNAVNGYAFVLMHEKLGGSKKGFPQLLEKENANAVKINSFDKYSWAFYKNNSLIDKGGKFAFEDNLLLYTNNPPVKNIYYVEQNNVQHLVYKTGANDVLLVTLTDNLRFKLFTEATYWFAFFFMLFLFFWLMMKILNRNLNIEFSFKNRIQISVMAIVLLSMILIGSFTVYFINSNYKKNQRLQLLEKLNSLQLVIENEYDNALVNDFNNDTLSPIFSRTSNALDCDFIIYDKQGVKSYSTKPTLFSLNIIGNIINRDAYNKLSLNASSSFVQNEMIGNLKYLSSYTGLYDNNNKLLGYINLPYITDPDELKIKFPNLSLPL
ncbi:MAG: hypothetical protein IPP29_07860 [Bacteroidetes bacterium]|nr:hypothetical protein [Bacteroidota bacterium]